MQIAGFDVDDKADGAGKAPITWIGWNLLNTTRKMNPDVKRNPDGTYIEGTGTIGGWEKTEVRIHLEENIKPMIPETVRSHIVKVIKQQQACDINGNTYKQSTHDDIWIPETGEFINAENIYEEILRKQERRIKRKNKESNPDWWWTREASNNFSYVAIRADGSTNSTFSYSSIPRIVLCFCT